MNTEQVLKMQSDVSAAETPPQLQRRKSQLVDKSPAITWLSEGRRIATRLRTNFPIARTPVNSRMRNSLILRSNQPVLRSNQPVERDFQITDFESILKGLVNKTWLVHKVSPMYLFSFKPSALKSYSKLLSSHIAMACEASNAAVAVDDNAANINIRSGRDKEFVEITLFQKTIHGNGGAGKVVLTAVLFAATNAQLDLHKSFTNLPLMLIKGPSKLKEHLISWWQIQFDSCISPVIISSMQLTWLAAMFAGSTTGRKSKHVEFVYKVPSEAIGLSTITYSIDAQDCRRVWESTCGDGSDDDVLTSQQVVSFISAWEEHFHHHFGIRLTVMQLLTIGTTVVYVSNDGRLKIYSEDHAQQIIAYLCQET